MNSEEQETAINELETRVDRLRVLYEQYFLGFEKLEPTVPRKEVDRRFAILRKEQIRNTALRFRFNVVTQKYNTYTMYWIRICRQIDDGTYKRHLQKAKKRFGDDVAAVDKRGDVEVDVSTFELDEEAVEALFAADPIPAASAPNASPWSPPRADAGPPKPPAPVPASSPSVKAARQYSPAVRPESSRDVGARTEESFSGPMPGPGGKKLIRRVRIEGEPAPEPAKAPAAPPPAAVPAPPPAAARPLAPPMTSTRPQVPQPQAARPPPPVPSRPQPPPVPSSPASRPQAPPVPASKPQISTGQAPPIPASRPQITPQAPPAPTSKPQLPAKPGDPARPPFRAPLIRPKKDG